MGPGSKTSGGGVALRDVRWRRRAGCLRAPLFVPLALTMMFAAAAPAAGRPAWQWPVDGQVLTPYRNDNAEPYAAGMHRGIDIRAAAGTPVLAATGGAVTFAGGLGSSGNVVAVASGDGRTTATYLHLATIDVEAVDAVRAGQRIGTVGTTGRRSVPEPHLHFGVHSSADPDYYFDPLDFLGDRPRAIPAAGASEHPPVAASLPATPVLGGARPARVNAERLEADATAQRGTLHNEGRQKTDGRARSVADRRAATAPRGVANGARKRVRSRTAWQRVPAPIKAGAVRASRSTVDGGAEAPGALPTSATQRASRSADSGFSRWIYVAAFALVLCAIAIPRQRKTRQLDPGFGSQAGSRDCGVPADASGGVRSAAGERHTVYDWQADSERRLRAVSGSK